MTTNLDKIQRQIKAGDIDEAKRMLTNLLRTDPDNANAWALQATLFDDPVQQADCYRQVLRIDPSNRQAAARLQALAGQSLEIYPQRQSSQEEEPILRCPQCGGAMDVRFVGEMQDKRAVCLHCNTEVDLPDTYQRVRKKRTHEQHYTGNRIVEETVIETRRDGQVTSEATESLPTEIQEMLQILNEKGPEALDEEFLQKLQARGLSVTFDPEAFDTESLQALQERGFKVYDGAPLEHSSKTVIIRSEHRDEGLLRRLLSRIGVTKQKPDLLSPSETIELAGGALSPEESRKCPNPTCGAVIPKDATKCSWCGKSL
jgi:hypothetical protein